MLTRCPVSSELVVQPLDALVTLTTCLHHAGPFFFSLPVSVKSSWPLALLRPVLAIPPSLVSEVDLQAVGCWPSFSAAIKD